MPEVYRGWKNKHNCSFHYLSAMPDQLYTITKEFVDEQDFPDGTFHMRYVFYRIFVFLSFIPSIVIFAGLQKQSIILYILWVSILTLFNLNIYLKLMI